MAEKELREWVRRLESGDYLQGKGFLCEDRGPSGLFWCCIGVLCDYAASEAVIRRPYRVEGGYLNYGAGLQHAPGVALAWVGITNDAEHYLINLNDGGKSFMDIAKDLRIRYGLGES